MNSSVNEQLILKDIHEYWFWRN